MLITIAILEPEFLRIKYYGKGVYLPPKTAEYYSLILIYDKTAENIMRVLLEFSSKFAGIFDECDDKICMNT